MKFSELCLLYESRLVLVKGNFDRPLTAEAYQAGITSFIRKKVGSGYSSIIFFLGKPDSPNNCFLELVFHVEQSMETPPRHFQYKLPQKTLKKFREQGGDIYNRNNEAYFQPRTNVFYYKGQPVAKVFPESKLRNELDALIKVNDFFVKNYGKQYGFLGDIYSIGEESTFSKLATSWEKNKEDIRNLPKYLGDFWSNL